MKKQIIAAIEKLKEFGVTSIAFDVDVTVLTFDPEAFKTFGFRTFVETSGLDSLFYLKGEISHGIDATTLVNAEELITMFGARNLNTEKTDELIKVIALAKELGIKSYSESSKYLLVSVATFAEMKNDHIQVEALTNETTRKTFYALESELDNLSCECVVRKEDMEKYFPELMEDSQNDSTQTLLEKEVDSMENKTVRNLVHDLDFELEGISCRVITLNDIRTLLGHLREDMDNVKEDNLRAYFREFHRTVRVLSELMIYTTDELKTEYEKSREIYYAIFDKVVKQGECNE